MTAEYDIILYTQEGTRLAVLDTTAGFEYMQVLNNVGRFKINLPTGFDKNLVAKNRRVGFWRKPGGGMRSQDFHGIVTRPNRKQGPGAEILRSIAGFSPNVLLKRRIVKYTAGSSQADKNGPADDMMKAIVRENLGSSGTRALPSSIFQVAGDAGLGPPLSRAFAWRNVLPVLQSLSDSARDAGTEVYFDVVPATETLLEFRTYIGQPGADRTSDSAAPLRLGTEFGNLRDAEFDENYDDEVNAVIGGGYGEGAARVQAIALTAEGSNDPFARAELFRDANETDVMSLFHVCEAELVAQRAIRRFTAQIENVPGAAYGIDWSFGDRVTATFDGEQFDALVRVVHVKVDGNGLETVTATLEAFA